MTFTFIYLMVILKIPILALLYIVWWAIHQDTDTVDVPPAGSPRPRTPVPTRTRAGRSRASRAAARTAARARLAPPRTRTVVARARRSSTDRPPRGLAHFAR